VARRLRPDHIYVPYGEGLAQMAGVASLIGLRLFPRDAEAEVLLMRGGYKYPAESRRRRLLNATAPRLIDRGPWARIHHLNTDDLAVLRRQARTPNRYRLMPDPADPPPATTAIESRRRLGIPEDGRYIGCAGGIDRRKGMHLIIRAFLASTSSLRADDRLLLAGPVEAQIRSILENEAASAVQEGRIIVIDRPLTAEEFGYALKSMDVVATPYPQFCHSSSIVIHAASCERPVLGSNIGWMQRTIQECQLGWTCNVRDAVQLRTELVRALDASAEFEPSERSRRFVDFHSPDNFRAHWMLRLRERLNLPADQNLVTWDSVLQEEAPALTRPFSSPVTPDEKQGSIRSPT
jgi:glycosyltransferase involved in cell wall biosynthesis